jgi:anti-sigma regulatory factor (Ser/Thr protein kinase)
VHESEATMIERTCRIEHHYKRDVLAVPASVGLLRDLAERQLSLWGAVQGLIDDATLVLSELATNSVAACPGSVLGFAMYVSGGALVIEVHDTSLEQPLRRRAGDYDVSGRGLDIVTFVAETWGVRRSPQGGKCIWARLVPRPG